MEQRSQELHLRRGLSGQLRSDGCVATMRVVAIDDRDLTTIMVTLGDIREDVSAIRQLLEDDDGEEEEIPEENT